MTETTALTRYEPKNLEEGSALATRIANSGLVPKALRGKPDDVLLVLATGAELGMGAAQSLRMIHCVEGKATLSADLMVALCLRSTACEYFRAVEQSSARSVWETKRRGSSAQRSIFTADDAKRAGLWGKPGPWSQYPERMLAARAKAFLARDAYPDLVGGFYTPDEAAVGDSLPTGGEPGVVSEPLRATIEVEPDPEPEAEISAPVKPPPGYLAAVEQVIKSLSEAGLPDARATMRRAVADAQASRKRWLTPDELRELGVDLLPATGDAEVVNG